MADTNLTAPPSHRQRLSERWRLADAGKKMRVAGVALLVPLALVYPLLWRAAGRSSSTTVLESPDTVEVVRWVSVLDSMAYPLTESARRLIGYSVVGTNPDGSDNVQLDPDAEGQVVGQLFDPRRTGGSVWDICAAYLDAGAGGLVVTHERTAEGVPLFDCSAGAVAPPGGADEGGTAAPELPATDAPVVPLEEAGD
jgi:hypothetical protein